MGMKVTLDREDMPTNTCPIPSGKGSDAKEAVENLHENVRHMVQEHPELKPVLDDFDRSNIHYRLNEYQ